MESSPSPTSETSPWSTLNANIAEQGGDVNTLHLAVTLNKIEAGVVATALPSDNAGVLSVAVPSSTYSIPDILKNVNPLDGDFLKYVPDGFLSDAQQEGKRQAQERERRKIAALRGEPADLTELYRTVANTTDADSPIRRSVEAMYRAALQGEMADRMAAKQYDTRSRRELNRARATEPTLAEQLRAVNGGTLLGDFTAADAAAQSLSCRGSDGYRK